MRSRFPWFCLLVLLAVRSSAADKPVAGIFMGEPGLTPEISQDIRAAGYTTEFIGAEVLTNSRVLRARQFDLLVLPGARTLPVTSMEAVGDYLRGGGRLMAFGLPAWESPTFALRGMWLSKKECQAVIDSLVADHGIVNFALWDATQWNRGADGADGADPRTQVETVTNDGKPALHVVVDNLTGWDVVVSPSLTNCFPDKRTLTCFRARGSADTRQMSIEWDEQDGSRWIATIDLAPEWKSYCLPPESFRFWESSIGRGGAGEHLDVRHVVRVSIGLARSHAALPGPRHEYWIGNIGSAKSPLEGMPSPEAVEPPRLDTLSPGWKFYPMRGPLKVATPAELALVSPVELQSPDEHGGLPQAMQPRPRAFGINQDRTWRWQSLLEARSPERDYRGAMAMLLVHFDDEFRRGIWACFTPDDATFYQQKGARQLVRETAAAIKRGLFLQDGGSQYFTVFEGQGVPLGARAINLGHSLQTNLSVRIRVKSKIGGQILFERQAAMDLIAGGNGMTLGSPWNPPDWPEGGMIVTTELIQDGQVLDRLEHELNVWHPNPSPEFITEQDGQFWWRGQPWKAHGVNYMPSSGIGDIGSDYFEYWLGKGAYDPEVIDRDLRRIKAMGLNAVSIFIHYDSLRTQHLLDFLRRCQDLGLHVNLSLRPGTPLDFQWDQMKELIEYYRMAQNDTIFAYDLAWEPEHVDQQRYYGRNWTSWVTTRHGSVANAVRAWGVPAPAGDASGILAVPPMHDLAQDGLWRGLSADYRLFLDEELAKKYGEARRLVRSIDPNHAVSFRMSEAGDPTMNSEQRLPFDFYGLAAAVDIWAPEAYGRIGDWNRVRDGRFEVDYARLCDPGKPVIWAEMGNPVWDERRGEPSVEKLEFTAGFYRDFYRMMTGAGCNGVFFWWYPGGYRANERSDFGIINPDGTDRPVTLVIREEGPKFLKAGRPPSADCVISINRDRDARGLFGIYQAVKADYWQAIANGKHPALQWDKKPGEK